MSYIPDHIIEEAAKWGKIGARIFYLAILLSIAAGIIQRGIFFSW